MILDIVVVFNLFMHPFIYFIRRNQLILFVLIYIYISAIDCLDIGSIDLHKELFFFAILIVFS